MPPKRAAADDAHTEENKKFRSAIDAMTGSARSITCELPVDPVVAEDGHVYERSAIEEHIRTKGAELKSPMTGLSMGRNSRLPVADSTYGRPKSLTKRSEALETNFFAIGWRSHGRARHGQGPTCRFPHPRAPTKCGNQ